jgi:seryl-tRNA synthetase
LGQNKEDANDLIEQKASMEKQKKEAEELAVQKEAQRDKKIRTIGNIVHESVPVSNNEVCCCWLQ